MDDFRNTNKTYIKHKKKFIVVLTYMALKSGRNIVVFHILRKPTKQRI